MEYKIKTEYKNKHLKLNLGSHVLEYNTYLITQSEMNYLMEKGIDFFFEKVESKKTEKKETNDTDKSE